MTIQTRLMIGLAGLFAGLFLLERCLPLRAPTRSLWRRLLVNFVVAGLALAITALLLKPYSSSFLGTEFVGLLGALPGSPWAKAVLGFLLLDLTFYYWHVLNHRVGFFWRFHNVHHIDPDLDVSTAFRFHFGESAMAATFRIAQLALIGVSAGTYVAYEFAFTAGTMFHHSNLRLPARAERWLNCVLVTPRMHGIHHSRIQREANSNYSVVLPWWDWLHRSLRLNVPQDQIVIGAPAYTLPEDNALGNVLWLPFRRQRDYWNSDGELAEPESSPQADQTPPAG